MAVSGVDNSRGDEVARTREEYSSRETKTAKKHKKEIENLQRSHFDDLQNVQTAYQKQLENQRVESRRLLSDRDKKYQQEMESIKQMHVNKLQEVGEKSSAEANLREDHLKKTLAHERQINQTQKENISGIFTDKVREQEEAYGKLAESSRETQVKALKDQRDRLNAAHSLEKENIIEAKNENLNNLQNEKNALMREKEFSKKESQVKDTNEKSRQEAKFQENLLLDRRLNQQESNRMKEGFDQNLKTLTEKYKNANEEREQRYKNDVLSLEGSSNTRNINQLEGLKRRINEEKMEHTTQQLEQKRLHDLETKNIQNDSEKRIQSMATERQVGIDENKRLTQQEVGSVNKKNQEVMKNLDAYYQGKLRYTKEVEMEALKQKNQNLVETNQHNQRKHDFTQTRSLENFQRDKQGTEEFYKSQIYEINRLHDVEKQDLKSESNRERNELTNRLLGRLRDNQQQADEKIANLTEKYETQIATLKESQTKENRRLQNFSEARKKEMERDFKMKLDAEKANHEGQLAAERERNYQEVEQLKKKFESEKIEMSKRKS